MIVIPAIDVFENKVVRLQKGKFEDMTVYNQSLIEQVQLYQQAGFTRLHIIDLLGSKKGIPQITKSIEAIKKSTTMQVQTGGGLRTLEKVQAVLNAGADYCIIGSAAINNVKEFEALVRFASPEKIIVAADALNGKIAIEAWQEVTEVTLQEHIEKCNTHFGLRTFLCTDIAKDGMMAGPNTKMYIDLQNGFPALDFIASGGISCIADVKALCDAGVYGVVVGKAIYEGTVTLQELQ
ncbi:MAG: tryptophan synthase subunit alpha, partial [Ignavibacteriales bacterium]|nr:tryptophan synthase subunit alpha [Ignavibacteriales bacterium]